MRHRLVVVGLVTAALFAPAQLAAQSAGDFRLPSGTPSPSNSRAVGPVDSDNPVVRRTEAAPPPVPSPSPSASASPPVTLPPPRPSPRASAPRPAATRAAPVPAITPTLAPSAAPTPLPEDAATSPALDLPMPGASTAAPALTPSAAEPVSGYGWWPWALAAAALLIGLAIGLLLKRRSRSGEIIEFEPPVVAPTAPPPAPPPAPTPFAPAPQPAAAKVDAAPARQAAKPKGLAVALEARRLNASLVATTLSYRLVVTNHSKQPLAALAVEGDMISAHASLSPDQQIARADQRLELRHALVELAPGESAEFTGDFRLSLAEVTPIRAGNAAYFVPLARFRVEAGGLDQPQVQTFVIGELPEAEGAALKPFRLDLGPRTFSRIGQRAVE